jgi:hypothetical protein
MNKFYNTINYHGFKGETPLARNLRGILAKTLDYMEWLRYFPFEELADKEEWEVTAGVDFEGFLGAEVCFMAIDEAKTANMMQGLIQLLKDKYDIPQGALIEVRTLRCENCESEFDGKIKFSIYNVEGVGFNE